jgi:hypothetical protein
MSTISDGEVREKQAALSEHIQHLLPDFAKSCGENEDAIILHQDSFAADYQQVEYALLGMAIKFARLYGKEGRIIGTNRDTFKRSRKPELIR